MSDDIVKHIMAQFDFDTDKFAALWQSIRQKLEAIAASLAPYEQGCKNAVEKFDASCRPTLERMADTVEHFPQNSRAMRPTPRPRCPTALLRALIKKSRNCPIRRTPPPKTSRGSKAGAISSATWGVS